MSSIWPTAARCPMGNASSSTRSRTAKARMSSSARSRSFLPRRSNKPASISSSVPSTHTSAASSIARWRIAHDAALEPRRATFARVAHIDEIIAIYFPAPHSYTGDDVVELSAHGSPVVLRAIVSMTIERGARLAEPGEFTLRAFLNGRIDLMQAEAVADLIDAVTPLQARAAFDQLRGTLTRTIGEIDAALFDLIARLEASVAFPEEGSHFVEPAELTRTLD